MTAQQKLKDYEYNMKVFIQKVERQVSELIEKYERKIHKLKQQNRRLKTSINRSQNPQSFELRDQTFPDFSPIKKFKDKSPDDIDTFFMISKQFPKVKPIFSNFQSHLDKESLNRSRFESVKLKQKQKQQNIIQSLESGKYNLDLNTSKMLELFGKQSKPKEEYYEEEEEEKRAKSLTKSSGAMNTSLSSICQSLDKSFHAQKSREKNQKKRKKEEEARQKKLQELRKNEQKRKDQGVKNLLKSLRNNVNSIKQEPEIIKGNKLLSSGNLSSKFSAKLTKSKVMFNPVPVDISQRQRNQANNSSLSNGQPQSILKNSSRILTKSLIGNITSMSENY